jgi:hypothetical protein
METKSGHLQIGALAGPARSALARAARYLQQFFCGLHGHDSLLHFEQGRMSLLCSSCGYQTPGWEVKRTGVRAQEATQTPRVIQLPLMGERRVA